MTSVDLRSLETMTVCEIPKSDNSESVGNWRGLQSHRWFCLQLICSLWIIQARCQDCDFPQTLAFTITETDPAGTELFNVSSHNGSNVFTYTPEKGWLTDFLNLTHNDTDFYYRMQLNKPLDLEEIYYNLSVTDISGFTFTLNCKSQTNRHRDYHIIVEAVNEWPPEFNTSSIDISVKETLPMRSMIINLTQWSSDKDVHPISREIAEYSFLSYTGDPQVDGHTWLEMLIAYDGIIVVKKELDYETLPQDKKYILLGVQVTDQGGKTGTASLTVYVEDDDDLPPVFNYTGCLQPCRVSYSVSVSPNFTGLVTGIKPAPIEAHDGDTLNYTIEYSIAQGTGDYAHYIHIDNVNGHLFILQELKEFGQNTLVLVVEAREVSQIARSTTTMLLISIQDGAQEETVILSNVDDDNTVIIVSAILGAAVVIVVVLLIIMMVYIKKRSRKSVFPANSVTSVQGGLDFPDGMNHQTLSTAQPNKDLHARKTDPSTILNNKDYGYADIEPSNSFDPHAADLLTKTPRTGILNSYGSTLNESPTSDLVIAFEDYHDDYLAAMPENQRNVITSDPTSTDTDVVDRLTTNDRDIEDEKSTTGPTLQILSGLKALESFKVGNDHYADFDKRGEYPSGTGIFEADHVGLKSDVKPILRPGPKKNKSSRKNKKSLRKPEEAMYDGVEIVGNVQFDSGFYTDSNKTRIKRSSRKSVMIPDPDDIRHWLTVEDD